MLVVAVPNHRVAHALAASGSFPPSVPATGSTGSCFGNHGQTGGCKHRVSRMPAVIALPAEDCVGVSILRGQANRTDGTFDPGLRTTSALRIRRCLASPCRPRRRSSKAKKVRANPRIWAGAPPKSKRVRRFIFMPVYSAAGVLDEYPLFARAAWSQHFAVTAVRRKCMKRGIFLKRMQVVRDAPRFARAFPRALRASRRGAWPGRGQK